MLKIGTRGSKLALWQAHDLQAQLKGLDIDSELVIIKTKGDEIQNLGFDKLEGKGFFTQEIEYALLAGDIDVAVHSMKDLPTEMVEGLSIAGLSKRANPADFLIIKKPSLDPSQPLMLKSGRKIGTSSIRRKVQLKHFDPTIDTVDVRGNVPTRLKKLNTEDYDAIVLAGAGVQRLEISLDDYHVIEFSPKEFVSAPAQGVIAYQCRTANKPTRRILKQIHDASTALCTNVERKVMKIMDGGCQLPLGAYCERDRAGNYHCYASYSPGHDQQLKHVKLSQSTHAGLAERIVEQLKSE